MSCTCPLNKRLLIADIWKRNSTDNAWFIRVRSGNDATGAIIRLHLMIVDALPYFPANSWIITECALLKINVGILNKLNLIVSWSNLINKIKKLFINFSIY